MIIHTNNSVMVLPGKTKAKFSNKKAKVKVEDLPEFEACSFQVSEESMGRFLQNFLLYVASPAFHVKAAELGLNKEDYQSKFSEFLYKYSFCPKEMDADFEKIFN